MSVCAKLSACAKFQFPRRSTGNDVVATISAVIFFFGGFHWYLKNSPGEKNRYIVNNIYLCHNGKKVNTFLLSQVLFVKVRKIKAIYHTLNYFNLDTSQKCLIAECWIPRLDMEAIQLALRRGTEKSGSTVARNEVFYYFDNHFYGKNSHS